MDIGLIEQSIMSSFISSETRAGHLVSFGRCSDYVEYSLLMQIDARSTLVELEWDK